MAISTATDLAPLVRKHAMIYRRVGITLGTLVPLLISLVIAVGNFKYPEAVGVGAGDHISHIGATIMFLAVGLEIYSKPVDAILKHARPDPTFAPGNHLEPEYLFVDPLNAASPPIYLNWPDRMRPYPPGDYLLFFPVAMLYHFRVIGLAWACRLVILGLLAFCTGISRIAFTFAMESTDVWSLAIRFVTAVVIAAWSFCWALRGFYDVAGLFLVFLSMRSLHRRKWIDAIFYFFLAAFVHSRALYAFPIVLIALFEDWKTGGHFLARWLRSPKIWIALAAAIVCAVCLWISLPYVKLFAPNNIYFHLSGRALHLQYAMALGVFLALVCAGGMIATGEIGGLLMLVFPWAFMLQTPEVRLWHSIFWLPLILYCAQNAQTPGRRWVWAATLAMVGYLTYLVYGIEFWLFT